MSNKRKGRNQSQAPNDTAPLGTADAGVTLSAADSMQDTNVDVSLNIPSQTANVGVIETPLIEVTDGTFNAMFPFPLPFSMSEDRYHTYDDKCKNLLSDMLTIYASMYSHLVLIPDDDVLSNFSFQLHEQIRLSMQMMSPGLTTPPQEYSLGVTLMYTLSLIPDLGRSSLYEEVAKLHDILKQFESLPEAGPLTVPQIH